MEAYLAEYGNCLVPLKDKYNGFSLGSWVSSQRKSKDTLSKEKIDKLDGLGFIWDAVEALWDATFEALQDYHNEHGHSSIPSTHSYGGYKLGSWVNTQRQNKNILTEERLDKLNSLSFKWNPFDAKWNKGFECLLDYHAKQKHTLVSANEKFKGYNLGKWVGDQRTKKDTLSEEKRNKLNSLGFGWNRYKDVWNTGFNFLMDYHAKHKHTLVPAREKFKGYNLGGWVSVQRTKKDTLSEEKRNKLNSLSFVWDGKEALWDAKFQPLKDYHSQYGHCLVTEEEKYNGHSLGRWVALQRKNRNTLSKKRLHKLNSLGFVWDPLQYQWNKYFECLIAYHTENGHCLVPDQTKYNGLMLGGWVYRQRKNKMKLSKENFDRLNGLEFVWNKKDRS